VKISAIVVTLNEEKYLRECLKSISFCDQILVVDLGSTDNSVAIAREFATDFITHVPVPFVEEIWYEYFPSLRNDWVLRVDPDEIFPLALSNEIQKLIHTDNGSIGSILIPYQYYYCGKPLNYTVWGGVRNFPKIYNKHRISLHVRVHTGISLKPGFVEFPLKYDGINYVQHYWIDSNEQLFAKHKRYLEHEGKSRYNNGQRFSWLKMFRLVYKCFKVSMFKKQGWRGGRDGIFLSFFYAKYEAVAHLSLRRYQTSISK
jgi:glycosyltransferase involved in cell wall biosynthesis